MDQTGGERYGGAGGHSGDTTDLLCIGDCLEIYRPHSWAINTASYNKSLITKKQNIQGKSAIFMRNIIINIGVFICKKS